MRSNHSCNFCIAVVLTFFLLALIYLAFSNGKEVLLKSVKLSKNLQEAPLRQKFNIEMFRFLLQKSSQTNWSICITAFKYQSLIVSCSFFRDLHSRYFTSKPYLTPDAYVDLTFRWIEHLFSSYLQSEHMKVDGSAEIRWPISGLLASHVCSELLHLQHATRGTIQRLIGIWYYP